MPKSLVLTVSILLSFIKSELHAQWRDRDGLEVHSVSTSSDSEKKSNEQTLKEITEEIKLAQEEFSKVINEESKKIDSVDWDRIEKALEPTAIALEKTKKLENTLKSLDTTQFYLWIASAGGALTFVGSMGYLIVSTLAIPFGGSSVMAIGEKIAISTLIGSVVVVVGSVGTNIFYIRPKTKKFDAAVKKSIVRATLIYKNYCDVIDLVKEKNPSFSFLEKHSDLIQLCASVRDSSEIQANLEKIELENH